MDYEIPNTAKINVFYVRAVDTSPHPAQTLFLFGDDLKPCAQFGRVSIFRHQPLMFPMHFNVMSMA
jgi:hypothetical protein